MEVGKLVLKITKKNLPLIANVKMTDRLDYVYLIDITKKNCRTLRFKTIFEFQFLTADGEMEVYLHDSIDTEQTVMPERLFTIDERLTFISEPDTIRVSQASSLTV